MRLWRLGTNSLTHDEGFSHEFASRPLIDIVTNLSEGNPPLYYTLPHGWRSAFGHSEVSLRLPSVLFGFAAVWLTGGVAQRLGGRHLAWLSMGLMAAAAMPVEFSQIARAYSSLLAFSLGSYLCLLRWEDHPRRERALLYGLVTVLMGYTHYYAIFNVVAQQTSVAWQVVNRRVSLRQWAVLLLPILLGYLPYLWIMSRHGPSLGEQTSWITRLDPLVLIVTLWLYVAHGPAPGLVWGYLALGVIGLFTLVRSGHAVVSAHPAGGATSKSTPQASTHRSTHGLLLPLWLGCPLIIPWLVSLMTRPIFWPRYTISAAPAFLILVSLGLLRIPTRVGRLAVACGLAAISAVSLSHHYAREPEAWRAAVRTLESVEQPGDALTISDEGIRPVFSYYYRGSLTAHPLPSAVSEQQRAGVQESLRRVTAGRTRLWMVVFPEPRPGRLISEVFVETYPAARLVAAKAFAGPIYLLGYDLATRDSVLDHAPGDTVPHRKQKRLGAASQPFVTITREYQTDSPSQQAGPMGLPLARDGPGSGS